MAFRIVDVAGRFACRRGGHAWAGLPARRVECQVPGLPLHHSFHDPGAPVPYAGILLSECDPGSVDTVHPRRQSTVCLHHLVSDAAWLNAARPRGDGDEPRIMCMLVA